jgi:subtilase family serine protease
VTGLLIAACAAMPGAAAAGPARRPAAEPAAGLAASGTAGSAASGTAGSAAAVPAGPAAPGAAGRAAAGPAGLAAAGLADRARGGGAGPGGGEQTDCESVVTCYTPQQIDVAYGLWPLLVNGIVGSGETVVLPELAEPQLLPPSITDIRQDLAGFDQRFGLPPARLQISTAYARGASRWLAYEEEVLDVEMVHAIAPGAAITVVLLPYSSMTSPAGMTAGLVDVLRVGTSSGDVVSISEGVGETCFTGAQVARLNAALRAAARQHVTVVASSGDTGPVANSCPSPLPLPDSSPLIEPNLPAADPLVLAVGGTSLTASHQTGAYIGETTWSVPPLNQGVDTLASGGGFSRVFARPGYQAGVPGIRGTRAVPDVAADASGATGMALILGEGRGRYLLTDSAGTSAGAPFWAGLVADADQYAGHDLGFVNPALYGIARGPAYHQAFHDITQGSSAVTVAPVTYTGYQAGPGWDAATGWGSPDAQVLVPLLAGDPAAG